MKRVSAETVDGRDVREKGPRVRAFLVSGGAKEWAISGWSKLSSSRDGDHPAAGYGALREVLRVGVLEGPDEYIFSDISAFTVGPDGEIYIAELEGDLRKFGPDGKFLRQIARRGAGPGEIEYVVGMAVSGEGELAAVDLGNQRISFWTPEGEFVRQVRRPKLRGTVLAGRLR